MGVGAGIGEPAGGLLGCGVLGEISVNGYQISEGGGAECAAFLLVSGDPGGAAKFRVTHQGRRETGRDREPKISTGSYRKS